MATRKQRKWRVQVVNDPESTLKLSWWRLRAPNGEIVSSAENYSAPAKARKTARRVFALMDQTKVVYEEVEG